MAGVGWYCRGKQYVELSTNKLKAINVWVIQTQIKSHKCMDTKNTNVWII